MAKYPSYPKADFSPNQNFLARDPSSSGQVVRVNGQSILDAAVTGVKNSGEVVISINDVSEVFGLVGYDMTNQKISLTGWHPRSDVGGGTLYWDSAALKSTHNGGTIFSPTVPWTTTTADYLNAVGETDPSGAGAWVRVVSSSLSEINIDATWYGASESLADNGVIYNAIFADTSILGIETPEGSYTLTTAVTVPDNIKRFKGAGKRLTKFIQSAADSPANPLTFSNGTEYADIGDFEVDLQIASTGTTTSKAVRFLGVRRSVFHDIHVEVTGHTVAAYSGVGLYMDMEAITNAYTNRIVNNTVIACTTGLWSVGPLTSTVITQNHFKTLNGIRFDRQSVQAGTTSIFGNQINDNLLQAHSSATFGAGNGIDFGQSDGALAFVYAFSNDIGVNYIEQFLNGILLRDGARNFSIESQNWDNATNEIIDLNTDKDGYSGFDAQNFKLSTKEQTIQFTAKGSEFTSKVDSAVTMDGTSDTLDIDANGVTITTDKRRIRIWGNGAARTGAILSRASAIEGQRVTLIGFSWNVALSTTGLQLNGGVAATLGNASTELALIEFEYDSSLDLWIEVSRNTRP